MNNSMEQIIQDDNNRQQKKRLKFIAIISSSVILIVMICIIISSFFSPLHRAEKILDKEIGSNIQITEAWYSKDENGCVISYSLGGISGIAGIFLNEDKVILQDTIDTMNNYSNNPYLSDTDKQNIAQTYFDSGAGSVVFWQYQIVRGDGDWKK